MTTRNKTPRKIRKARDLRRRYGITLEDYHLQFEVQQGKCAICDGDTDTLCVDHDHDNGNIRGLLCHNCNKGLGLLGDTLQRIERAYIYILIANDNEPPTEL